MKYAVAVSSKTGNTALLGETVQEAMEGETCIYAGPPDEKALEADCIFVGFWTDKGNCDERTGMFLNRIEHKKLFLFGTAGFGGSQEYFQQILDRVKLQVPPSNTILGAFMCQGKMGSAVRQRYASLQEQHPEDQKYAGLIANFDQALPHPDSQDREALKEAVVKALE